MDLTIKHLKLARSRWDNYKRLYTPIELLVTDIYEKSFEDLLTICGNAMFEACTVTYEKSILSKIIENMAPKENVRKFEIFKR
jgi:hypothetical protein